MCVDDGPSRLDSSARLSHLTFAWANLFWSCDHPDCCGNHKDRRVKDYDPDDVIDPSKEDPDHFFRFRSDGRIDLKPGLDENERHRAQITLKVFNLDPGRCRLRNLRKLKAKHYLDMNPSLLEALDSFTPEDREEFIREEIEATASEPFWTVVRHLFIDFRSANVP